MSISENIKTWNELSDSEKATLAFLFGIQIATAYLSQSLDNAAWINHRKSIQNSLEASSQAKFTAHNYRQIEKLGLIEQKPVNQRQQHNDIEIHLTQAGWLFMHSIISDSDMIIAATQDMAEFMLEQADDQNPENRDEQVSMSGDAEWDKLTRRQQDFLIAALIVTDWQKEINAVNPQAVMNFVPSLGKNDPLQIEDWQWFWGNEKSTAAALLIAYDPAYKPKNPRFHPIMLNAKGFNSTWRALVNREYMGKAYNFSTNSYYLTPKSIIMLERLQKKAILANPYSEGEKRFPHYQVAYEYAHHKLNNKS